ncbi:MAG: AMP-binding protein [Micrococcales bacterium]|nr:AMP-binding protein [Micrococcales bacterium]
MPRSPPCRPTRHSPLQRSSGGEPVADRGGAAGSVAEAKDLVAAVDRAARLWPDRPAWTFDPGESLTFADVARRSAGLAAALADQRVAVGDRVAVMMANRAEFPLTWVALARLGATMVPLNPQYRADDAGHILEHSRAASVVASGDLTGCVREALACADLDVPVLGVERLPGAGLPLGSSRAPAHRVAAEDTVNIQYTSGTTGRPKGCVLSHRYWMELGGGLVDEFPHLGPGDTMLTAQAFSYIDPQWNVVAAMLAGAHLVVLDAFHPSTFWSKVREHAVTYFYCLAAMPTLLLKMPPDPLDRSHRVRVVQCSAIPPARHEELEKRWGVKWYEAFGMTETGADLRVTDADHDLLVGSGCVGAAARAREARIVDAQNLPVPRGEVGELVLRGPGLMDRYEADPDATAAAFRGGWFHTGDLGRMDEAGRVYLVGRLKDMIRRAGENVSAREVEEVLLTHDAVRLAAVVPVPDDLRGEEVKAFVSLAGADRPEQLLLGELAEHCGQRLARFKVPRYWEVCDDLPVTASHRVAKARLVPVPGRTWDRVDGVWR